jgi:hypothetical protein
MSWPFACKHCGSRDVQATADEIQCLVCGRLTDKDGIAISHEEQHTSEEL